MRSGTASRAVATCWVGTIALRSYDPHGGLHSPDPKTVLGATVVFGALALGAKAVPQLVTAFSVAIVVGLILRSGTQTVRARKNAPTHSTEEVPT